MQMDGVWDGGQKFVSQIDGILDSGDETELNSCK